MNQVQQIWKELHRRDSNNCRRPLTVFTVVLRGGGLLDHSFQVQSLTHERFNELLALPVNESFEKEYNK